MPVKIGWASRHKPLQAQIQELKRIFGDVPIIIQAPTPFSSADEVADFFRKLGVDKVVVVLPLSMIAVLVEKHKDIMWIWSQMADKHQDCTGPKCPIFNKDSDVILQNKHMDRYRHVTFQKFMKIEKIDMILSDLTTGQ